MRHPKRSVCEIFPGKIYFFVLFTFVFKFIIVGQNVEILRPEISEK